MNLRHSRSRECFDSKLQESLKWLARLVAVRLRDNQMRAGNDVPIRMISAWIAIVAQRKERSKPPTIDGI